MIKFGVGDGIRRSSMVDDGFSEEVVGDLLFFLGAVVRGMCTLVFERLLTAFAIINSTTKIVFCIIIPTT